MIRRGAKPRVFARPGQALVEFALVVILLMFLILGLIQFGRAWQAAHVLTDSAREIGRRAAVADPTVTMDTLTQVVQRALFLNGFDSTNVQIGVVGTIGAAGATGDSIRINLQYPLHMGWLQSLMQWTTGQATLDLKTTMLFRHE